MTTRPRVLWVTDEAPDRAGGGGNIRQSHLFEGLAAIADVDLLLAGSGEPDSVVAASAADVIRVPLERGGTPSKTARRLHDLKSVTPLGPAERLSGQGARLALGGPLRRCLAAQNYDVVVIHHLALAPLAALVQDAPVWLEAQHLASRDAAQRVALEPGPRHRLLRQAEVRQSRSYEHRWARAADGVIAVSEEDALALPVRAVVIPNGVDVDYWRPPAPFLPPEPRVVFTGTLGYAPNVDGIGWFVSDIWPLVRAAVPAATLSIVGREPAPLVSQLASVPGVTVVANPADVRPYLWQARVAVVPLRFGSGTRLKALEALAGGRLLVGTSIGLEGLGLETSIGVEVHNAAPDFAASVIDALVAPLPPTAGVMTELAAPWSWRGLGSRYSKVLLDRA